MPRLASESFDPVSPGQIASVGEDPRTLFPHQLADGGSHETSRIIEKDTLVPKPARHTVSPGL
jgi:hypothetical protein